jgi:hypothetical protein
MSTPAIIKVEGVEYARVYKHYDGYPEATLPWLKAFNEDFHKNRGDDPSYKFAQLLRDSNNKDFNLDDSKHTGWGVVDPKEWDCGEYTYTLKSDGTVEVG